jgi:transmembrane sensor
MPRKPEQEHTPNDDQQWQQAWEQPDAIEPVHKQALLNNIHQQLDGTRRKKKQLYFIGISAAAAILIAVMIKMPWGQQEIPAEAWKELATNDSARKIQLEDGSVLWLAPHSAVKLHPDFLNRRSSLLEKGTVFFHVAKDTLHPFSITVNRQQVTVLGTQFTVNKLDSTDIQLTVKEGKVALDNASGRNVLTMGQQVHTRQENTGAIQTVDPMTADWWAKSEIRLLNISLQILIRCIETYYGVTLYYGRINPDMKVSLTWDMTISIKDNLKVVNALTGYNIH